MNTPIRKRASDGARKERERERKRERERERKKERETCSGKILLPTGTPIETPSTGTHTGRCTE